MAARTLRRSLAANTQAQGATVSTILIGVDDSQRSEDAIAFGRRLAEDSGAKILVACAYPYDDSPSRASNAAYRAALRDEALETARTMAGSLDAPTERANYAVTPNTSPAHALHKLADAEDAALIVVGSTHTGRAGRVLPGSTGERLLHGSPCPVAIVPKGYREPGDTPIRHIGVAYNGSDEARAALSAAVEVARALGATLEVIGVVLAESYGTPAMMGGPSQVTLRVDIERHIQESLDAAVALVPADIAATSVRLAGGAADAIAERSDGLDLLITGSRGYGPLHSVLVGGVSGQLARTAHCPLIVVPRSVETPLAGLFGGAATTAA
jgi:nucleotide-binding universal stress UspA family protein